MTKSFERVAPTALSTAYRRTFSDIPYAKEIYSELERLRLAAGQPDIPEELKSRKTAMMFEARHKIVDKLLRESKIHQVLEVAAGYSSRGLAFAEEFPGTDDRWTMYVEVDLPHVAMNKRDVITSIKGRFPEELKVVSGNALKLEDLQFAAEYFSLERPIAVINEGLLRYLNFEEKSQYARNVHSLLKEYGGVWITPDVILKKFLQRQNSVAKKENDQIKKITGINIDENAFDSVHGAKEFFEKIGFDVEVHNDLEVTDDLVSWKGLGISRLLLEIALEESPSFVMKAR